MFIAWLSSKGYWLMDQIVLKNSLKVARAEKNLSQEDLANLVGVTRQTISSIETGQYCPSALLAFQLARKLAKPVEGLFFLEGNEK
jgi:putative transcriptional regulator